MQILKRWDGRAGDGYAMLKQGQNIYDTGTGINSLLVRYIEMVGTITRPSDQE